MSETFDCDTCGHRGPITDMNGNQCFRCYAPGAPRMTWDQWDRAGRPAPVVIVEWTYLHHLAAQERATRKHHLAAQGGRIREEA